MFLKKFLIILALVFFFVPNCRAQREKVGLSVDQSIFSFNLYPGEEKEFVLKIRNITDEKQRVKVNLKDFSVSDNNKISLLVEKNELYGMREWIIVEEDDVWMMEGGEEKPVKFTIKVPDDASVGSHYSAVLFNVLPEIDFENFQKPIIGGEIGSYIFLNVGGEISGNGKIKDFLSPRVVEKEADFRVTFENQGNVHYVPHGEIKIKNVLNGKRFDNQLDKHFVFPGKSYSFEYNWQVPTSFGVYTAEAFFVDQAGRNLSEEKLLFGKMFLITFFAFMLALVAGIIMIKRKRRILKLLVNKFKQNGVIHNKQSLKIENPPKNKE